MRKIVIELLLCASLVCGETVIHAPTVKGPLDASGASSTKPVKTGASLPAACESGELFFHTGAAAGKNLYICQPANTWSQPGGPATVQTGAALPATCAAGDLFLKSGTDPSRMLHICSATNQWSQTAYLQGTVAQLPATCVTGQMYFATDASEAGKNLRFCTAANTWTQAAGGGASLPAQSGNAGAYLTTDGAAASWKSADRGSMAGGYWDLRSFFGNGPATPTAITAAANQTNTILVYFPRITFNTVFFTVTTVCTPCNARIAIYSTDKSTRLWDSGAVTDAAGVTDVTTNQPGGVGVLGTKRWSGVDTTLPEGWAYLTWASDSTSLAMATNYTGSGSYSLQYNLVSLLGPASGGISANASGGAPYDLPGTLGTLALGGSTRAPELVFQRR